MRSLPGDARSSPRDTRRDHRLDFWRGLCLIDMVLVHLVYANLQFGDTLHDWIANYTRFAAGGFIFIAGLSIGKIYLPRVFDPCRRRATHFSLLRRSIYVLLVQYISTFGFIIVDSLRGQTAPFAFWPMVRDILMLREGGDLLPFYVMMIALSPIILEALRYRFAWIGVAALSIALFVWGQWHPFFLAIAAQQYFPPILWQVIFIGGVLAGAALPKYDALPKRAKMLALLIVVAIFAVLFDSEFSSCFGLPPLDLHLTFSKVPLSGGEVLRYFSLTLAIFMSTDLLWPVLKRWPGVGFVKTLGRKSLPVYIAQAWVVEAAGVIAATGAWAGRRQIFLAVASIAVLWVFAKVLELLANFPPRRWIVFVAGIGRGERESAESVVGAMQ